jgi:hypothetical protein
MGIYDTDSTAFPGTLLRATPTVATTSTGPQFGTLTSNLTLTPGWYWLAVCPQVASVTMRSAAPGTVGALGLTSVGSVSGLGLSPDGYTATDASGANTVFSGALPTAFYENAAPLVTASGIAPRAWLHTV